MSIVLGTPTIYHNAKYCSDNDHILKEKTKRAILNQMKQVFQKYSIHVKEVDPSIGKSLYICSLLWVRDLFVKIDNTFVLLPCVRKTDDGLRRRDEYKSIIPLLKSQTTILHDVPESLLEGGDILQHKNKLFVGIGKRTNKKGAHFLLTQFPEKTVVTIRHSALHLDCCFCILNRSTVLYAKKYITYLPKAITDEYNCYDIETIAGTRMTNLATNMVLIGGVVVTAYNPELEDLYRFIRRKKFKIEFIDFYGLEQEGGGVRCLVQWMDVPESQKIL